ncbi:MAG TPA: ATP-binding protein [Flavisolibacter sp.]|nr:ATP-binding protein [Flavisolibacter sp.]
MWLFLISVGLIIWIQFNSQKNNERLIQGSKHILSEVKIQADLRRLESDVLSIDNEIESALIAGNPAFITAVGDKLNSIKNKADNLNTATENSSATAEIATLKKLIANKILSTQQVLTAYTEQGRERAKAVMNTTKELQLNNNIIAAINKVDNSRQAYLEQVITSMETRGSRAKMPGLILAVLACITCALAFLYITNKDRRQQRAISLLNESERRINEAAKIKEQFLANMSHEIRTPINTILGFTNLLKKTSLDTNQHQYVTYINSSGENLLTLINDILDLSKIEAGMMNIEEAPFSLNGLVSSIEIMFREKAISKGITLEVTIEPNLHDTLYGDAVRLTQILTNLLSNAIKFTERGSVHLSVQPVQQHEDIIELQFNVQDTGVGIATDKTKKIFNRFQQAEAQTTREFGGTGLGLSIVKQLVDIQNGTIRVTSETGKGSTFSVNLPFKMAYNEVKKQIISAEQIIPELRNIKILIAEDNIMNQQLIRHLMQQWEVEYRIVQNGHEVLDALKQELFSVVLMDIQMPEMDGYTATMTIRNELKLNVPIIAMTAHAMPGEKERCIGYGMNDYISKPISDVALYAILKQHARAETGEKTGTGLINLDYLRELSMGDEDFEATIIQQFIVQVPEELRLMRTAINLGDNAMITGLAHSMKSSVSYLGLNERLYQILHRIETEDRSDDPTHLKRDFEELVSVCLQSVEEAKQLVAALDCNIKSEG